MQGSWDSPGALDGPLLAMPSAALAQECMLLCLFCHTCTSMTSASAQELLQAAWHSGRSGDISSSLAEKRTQATSSSEAQTRSHCKNCPPVPVPSHSCCPYACVVLVLAFQCTMRTLVAAAVDRDEMPNPLQFRFTNKLSPQFFIGPKSGSMLAPRRAEKQELRPGVD